MDNSEEIQRRVCERWGADYVKVDCTQKLGIAKEARCSVYPLNGLRHPPQGDTSGWYIWAGDEIGTADDYFLPLHIAHLDEWCPTVIKYLGLAPGWRFLIAPGHEDVWFDESLLNI